jgi:hypothetical protein
MPSSLPHILQSHQEVAIGMNLTSELAGCCARVGSSTPSFAWTATVGAILKTTTGFPSCIRKVSKICHTTRNLFSLNSTLPNRQFFGTQQLFPCAQTNSTPSSRRSAPSSWCPMSTPAAQPRARPAQPGGASAPPTGAPAALRCDSPLVMRDRPKHTRRIHSISFLWPDESLSMAHFLFRCVRRTRSVPGSTNVRHRQDVTRAP